MPINAMAYTYCIECLHHTVAYDLLINRGCWQLLHVILNVSPEECVGLAVSKINQENAVTITKRNRPTIYKVSIHKIKSSLGSQSLNKAIRLVWFYNKSVIINLIKSAVIVFRRTRSRLAVINKTILQMFP